MRDRYLAAHQAGSRAGSYTQDQRYHVSRPADRSTSDFSCWRALVRDGREESARASSKAFRSSPDTVSVGRALVQQSLRWACRCVPLCATGAKAADIAAAGAVIAVADLSRIETLMPALVGIDRAYLMTAADPQQVMLRSNFIDAAKQSFQSRSTARSACHRVAGESYGRPELF